MALSPTFTHLHTFLPSCTHPSLRVNFTNAQTYCPAKGYKSHRHWQGREGFVPGFKAFFHLHCVFQLVVRNSHKIKHTQSHYVQCGCKHASSAPPCASRSPISLLKQQPNPDFSPIFSSDFPTLLTRPSNSPCRKLILAPPAAHRIHVWTLELEFVCFSCATTSLCMHDYIHVVCCATAIAAVLCFYMSCCVSCCVESCDVIGCVCASRSVLSKLSFVGWPPWLVATRGSDTCNVKTQHNGKKRCNKLYTIKHKILQTYKSH